MSETAAGNYEKQRAERRIRVHLPVKVRGMDRTGERFDERTTSEDVCRRGVAFLLSHDIELGTDLEISIPLPPRQGSKQERKPDFATRGRVRHIEARESGQVVGVEFTGPRFHHVFLSESPLDA